MSTMFFKRTGMFYLPVHAIGWLATIVSVFACVWFFIAIDRTSHSASDTLLHFFVYSTCVFFWWKWLADATSKKD